jgi:hypothetical protein
VFDSGDQNNVRFLVRASNGKVLLNAKFYKTMKLIKNGEKQCTTLLALPEGMKGILIRVGKKEEMDRLTEKVESIISLMQ